MNKMNHIDKEDGRVSGGDGHTSFIITDDLKVQVSSFGLALNVLKVLGYTNWDKLAERVYNVNRKELVTLLKSLFTSDTPLANTFLKKSNSNGMKRIHKMLSPAMCKDRKESKDDQTTTLNACVNKKEGNIVYVECGEDFVDLLLTFLAMPLESVWETSANRSIFTCIENLSRSLKDLSVGFGRESECVVPYYHKCQNQLLDVVTTHKPPTYRLRISSATNSTFLGMKVVTMRENNVTLISIDPQSEGDSHSADYSTTPTGGFVKRGIHFLVLGDLSIPLSNLTSSIGLLKRKQIQCDDVEVQSIIIRKEEAIRLLEAALMTSTALSNALLAVQSASTSFPRPDDIRHLRVKLEERFSQRGKY